MIYFVKGFSFHTSCNKGQIVRGGVVGQLNELKSEFKKKKKTFTVQYVPLAEQCFETL